MGTVTFYNLNPRVFFFATSGLYIPLSGVQHIAICDVTPGDSLAEGKNVMRKRAALAAPRPVSSFRVDSTAESEARFDIYV